MSTILVTMMPYWSGKIGVPRTAGVEFPFGHTLGHAGDAQEQAAVIGDALRVLAEVQEPGTVVDGLRTLEARVAAREAGAHHPAA